MARVAAAYPDDLDVGTLYAEALFLLLPGPRAFSVADPTVARVLTVLEGALKRDVRHPGACHLYIHMTELTPEPERAVACAEDTRAIDRLAIRFDRAEPWTSFAICPAPATPAIWSLWEYRWKPAKAGVYRIFLRVVDSSVLQRRLDTGYYVRQVRIAEV